MGYFQVCFKDGDQSTLFVWNLPFQHLSLCVIFTVLPHLKVTLRVQDRSSFPVTVYRFTN